MRLIDADKHKGKCICNHLYSGVTKLVEIDAVPTAFDLESVIKQLQTELGLSDKEKERCARENPLQFEEAKGYSHGMSVALEIFKSAINKKEWNMKQ